MLFSDRLLQWYDQNSRPLPWRQNTDAYVVWITEIILQQTRVDQGLEYFHRFLEAFPGLADLAQAPVENVLRIWQGLGYYTRARNLHAAAQEIFFNKNGKLPTNYNDWLKVKGVGPYTAAAIASIAFNEPVAAIDGNGFRILTRIFAVEHEIDTAKGKKVINTIADELIDKNHPGAFNQALMDFGSSICKPSVPLCKQCIFNRECLAFLQGRPEKFPRKKPKKAVKKRHLNYFYFLFDDNGRACFFVKQRKEKDIWKGLFELPVIETESEKELDQIIKLPAWGWWLQSDADFVLTSSPIIINHKLTHFNIMATFFTVKLNKKSAKGLINHFQQVDLQSFEKMPKSRLTQRFFQKQENNSTV